MDSPIHILNNWGQVYIFSTKNGLATYHGNWPSLNLSQNVGKGWTNRYWKHQVLMFYPLGKKTQKNLRGVASTPPPPPPKPVVRVRVNAYRASFRLDPSVNIDRKLIFVLTVSRGKWTTLQTDSFNLSDVWDRTPCDVPSVSVKTGFPCKKSMSSLEINGWREALFGQ